MSMTNISTKSQQVANTGSMLLPIFPGVNLEVRNIVEFQMSAQVRNQLGAITRMRSSTAAANLKSNK